LHLYLIYQQFSYKEIKVLCYIVPV